MRGTSPRRLALALVLDPQLVRELKDSLCLLLTRHGNMTEKISDLAEFVSIQGYYSFNEKCTSQVYIFNGKGSLSRVFLYVFVSFTPVWQDASHRVSDMLPYQPDKGENPDMGQEALICRVDSETSRTRNACRTPMVCHITTTQRYIQRCCTALNLLVLHNEFLLQVSGHTGVLHTPVEPHYTG